MVNHPNRSRKQSVDSDYETLKKAALDYLSECDNSAPDALHRRTLRNHLRRLVGAPEEPPPRPSRWR